MYQQFNSIDVHRNIKSSTTTTFVFNCIFGLIIGLFLSVLVLALLPLYLPFHNFIPASLDNNNILPTTSNTSTVLIDNKNWPTVEKTIQNFFNLKLHNIQFTNISDIRIVNSISSKYVSTTWCNTNGCLQVLGEVLFSIDCPLACQLRKMNKIETSNLIEPSIKLNLNSTSNINYIIELDAFTIIISEGEENGDQMKIFLLYNLMENQGRTLSSMSISVDNSSLINITRLVNNSIIQSHMSIYKFLVVQADMKCMIDCQEIQVNKLKNTTLNILDSIVIIYDGKIHFHYVSLTGVFTEPVITENTLLPDISTIETTSLSIIDVMESIFEVDYKLEPFDLIIDGDLQSGPITDYSTLDDLTNMMQTTVANYSNITVFVFNATIEIDNENSTTKSLSSNSINYILRLIVYYIYSITCDECIRISNNAVYSEPQLNILIQIRNATLIDISSPIIVINITPNQRTTSHSSTYTVSMSTVQFLTTDSNDRYSIDNNETISSTLIHTTTHLTTNQNQITDHTSTIFHSSGYSTLHTTEHSTLHTTEHSTLHTTEHSTVHTTEHTTHYTTEQSTLSTTEHTTHHNTEQPTLYTTEHSTVHTTEHTTHHTTENMTHDISEPTTTHLDTSNHS